MFKKLKSWAKEIKSNIITLYLVLKRNDIKWYVKAFIALIVGYSFSPIDLIPDFIPILGYLDDIIIVPLGIIVAMKLIPKRIFDECKVQSQNIIVSKSFKIKAGIIIILIWILLITFLLIEYYDDIIGILN